MARSRLRTFAASTALAALVTTTIAAHDAEPPSCSGDQVIDNLTLETSGDAPITLAYTVIRPAEASDTFQVPVILHSHGWGGSRSTGGFSAWTGACMAVVSFDQRGFGASAGEANVQDPRFEAQDVKSLIDWIAAQPWVLHDQIDDGEGGLVDDPTDPVLGAIGGSYGGGYQWITALTETRESGSTRFNAIAPEISWYDLPESLAPQTVVRTVWVSALYAAGASAVPQYIHEAFAYGAATGQWPDGEFQPGQGLADPGLEPDIDAEFNAHSPVSFVDDGVQLDVPALILQGTTDNLFNLNEGVHNFLDTLTAAARSRSTFVAYNGGHALPSAVPLGSASGGNECASQAGGWDGVRITYYQRAFGFDHGSTADLFGTGTQSVGTTADGDCIAIESLEIGGGPDVSANVDVTLEDGYIALTGAGAPINLPLLTASEPMTLAGVPTLDYEAFNVGVDSRVFFALSRGTNQADATIIQNNTMPLYLPAPTQPAAGVPDTYAGTIELPGVVVELDAGESLFLTVSGTADMFAGHGSIRTPGMVIFDDLAVSLPLD